MDSSMPRPQQHAFQPERRAEPGLLSAKTKDSRAVNGLTRAKLLTRASNLTSV
jgi:hypothetical protein